MSGETERRKSYVSRSVMLPVQIVCWILPGTSSFLNFAGTDGARDGMCRSPIMRMRTILAVVAEEARQQNRPYGFLGYLSSQAGEIIDANAF
jgi:hypothetical protein